MVGTGISESGGIASVLRTYKDSGLLDQWNIELIQTHTNKSHLWGLNKLFLFLVSIFKILSRLSLNNIGFVHIHLASRGSFTRKSIIISICQAFKTPIILHLHGAEFREFYQNECSLKKQEKIRQAFNACDRIIVLSSQWNSWAKTIVKSPQKIITIYNAVPEIPRPRGNVTPYTALFLGRLGQRKGVFDLLKAAQLLAKDFPSFKLILGGDGEESECKNIAAKYGIQDNVEFAGWVSGVDKENLLLTSTVYILPSYNEGFPMGVLEAMSAKIPVIASKAGGIPDAITSEQEGILIDAGDVDAIYFTLKDAFTHQKKFANFAEKANHKFQENFSFKAVIPKVSSLYKEVSSETR